MNPNNIQAPTFSASALSSQAQHAVSTRGTPATLNLDDIFGDCFFTPEGDAVFLSEQQQQQQSNQQSNTNTNDNIAEGMNLQLSGETNVTTVASRPVIQNNTNTNSTNTNQQFAPVANAGGITTTGLSTNGARATTMGPATSDTMSNQKLNPMVAPPQQRHHIQFATTLPPAGSSSSNAAMVNKTSVGSIGGLGGVGTKKRGGASARERKMSDQQKSERRYVTLLIEDWM